MGPARAATVFFGPDAVLDDRPVTADVKLPGGSWQILARPHNGWAAALPNPLGFRVLVTVASLLVLVPLFVARFLIDERQRSTFARCATANTSSRCCRGASVSRSTPPRSGCCEYNIDTDTLVWDDRMNDLYGQPRDGKPRNYQHWKTALHPDDLERAQKEFTEAVRAPGPLPLRVPPAHGRRNRARHSRHRHLLPRNRRLVAHRRRQLGRVGRRCDPQDLERANGADRGAQRRAGRGDRAHRAQRRSTTR